MRLKDLKIINEEVKETANGKRFYYGRFIPHTRFMFIAEMPSIPKDCDPYDNFNSESSKTDKKIFSVLNENSFGGSYITDIVKISNIVRRPTDEELLTWRPLLKREIDIIRPDVIIAVGGSAYKILHKHKDFLGINVPIEEIYHPAQMTITWKEYCEKIEHLSIKYRHLRSSEN